MFLGWVKSYGFPGGTSGRQPICQCRRYKPTCSISGSRRSSGEGYGNPLWYSCLENPLDRRPWWATVRRVPNSWTWLKWLRAPASVGAHTHTLPRRRSGKEFASHCRRWRDVGLIRGPGRSPGAGNGNLLHYSCLENSMDRGAWPATVHGVTRCQIWLSDWAHTHRIIYYVE